jgi:GNAT superfamily N-acetyltransferase
MAGVEAPTLRPCTPDDAEILFAIHRESAMTAYAHIFPPDRYPFPDDEMRAHWVTALADPKTDMVVAERAQGADSAAPTEAVPAKQRTRRPSRHVLPNGIASDASAVPVAFEPIGFVGVSPGWLRNLFVLPAEWGRGAGSLLHDEAVRLLRAKEAGARLWVLEENERARRFYEQRGWRHDGERRPSDYPPYPPALRYELEIARRSHPEPPPTRGWNGR